jgi:hypothetical protein
MGNEVFRFLLMRIYWSVLNEALRILTICLFLTKCFENGS